MLVGLREGEGERYGSKKKLNESKSTGVHFNTHLEVNARCISFAVGILSSFSTKPMCPNLNFCF